MRQLDLRTVFSALALAFATNAGCGGAVSHDPGSNTAGNSGTAGSTGQCQGCPNTGCGPGTHSVEAPGDCCPSCVPDATGGASSGTAGAASAGAAGAPCMQSCVGTNCAPGYSLQVAPGQCCPTCLPNPPACVMGQDGYNALRASLLTPAALTCATDSDCVYLQDVLACGYACQATPISAGAASAVDAELASYGQMACASCPMTALPCPAPLPPACVSGQCAPQPYRD